MTCLVHQRRVGKLKLKKKLSERGKDTDLVDLRERITTAGKTEAAKNWERFGEDAVTIFNTMQMIGDNVVHGFMCRMVLCISGTTQKLGQNTTKSSLCSSYHAYRCTTYTVVQRCSRSTVLLQLRRLLYVRTVRD